MRAEEADAVAGALGRRVVSAARLAGGYSHETSLLTLDGGGQVVARLGGPDPAVEAAVMALAFGAAAPDADWLYLGRVLDMFALSDLVTRPPGHPVADQAATVIREWVAGGRLGPPHDQ